MLNQEVWDGSGVGPHLICNKVLGKRKRNASVVIVVACNVVAVRLYIYQWF